MRLSGATSNVVYQVAGTQRLVHVQRRGPNARDYDGKPVTIADLPGDALAVHGLRVAGRVLRNPSTSQLYAAALDRDEGVLSDSGGLVVDTGRFTGRSLKD